MTFAAMRADLQRRGLVDDQYRLTEAGNAYCVALLEVLPTRQASPCPPEKPRVRWTRRNRS